MSSTVGKEGYNLPIFYVNQAPEVAVAFVVCCLGDLILEKGRMKIQALSLMPLTYGSKATAIPP